MARFFVLVVSCWLLVVSCTDAATLKKIRYQPYNEKVRIVFDLEGPVYYQVKKEARGFSVALFDCITKNEGYRSYSVKDWAVRSLEVKKDGNNTIVYFPLEYPVQYEVFPLAEPSRLVVDFGREFSKVESSSKITEGLEYSYVTKGTKAGFVSAHVLLADPKKVEVFPALAASSPGVFESLMNIFTPWQKVRRIEFSLEPVSAIVDKYNAIAGINGTYFSYAGLPLGVFVINGELVSYPIYNRTSLIIDEKGEAAIDQVLLDGYVEINGERYEITGVNEPRDNDDAIIFTKYFGERTGTNRQGYELTIEGGKVTAGSVGNSLIPDDGFVVSFSPMFIEHVFSKVKINDKAKINLEMAPYSGDITNKILHVMGGGPQILKKGKIYVSKNFEKFKSDIALGRAARSAAGVTRDKRILLVTVDGKPRHGSPYANMEYASSVGITLEELAHLMASLGALDAVNLDGGGSTAMVVNNQVINRPVYGRERPVSNALLIRSLE